MIGLSVKTSGRFLTNPAAVKHDIGLALESSVRVVSLGIRNALRKEMTGTGVVDPFWGKGAPADDKIARRTGGTVQRLSPAGRVYRHGAHITTAVGSPDQHVVELEEGGTFSAGGGFFRIPTSAAKTAAGVDRYAGKSIRDIPNTHLYRNPISHQLWAYQSAAGALGRRAHKLLYLLVKKITRRARHIFARVTRTMEPEFRRVTGQRIALAVEKANR